MAFVNEYVSEEDIRKYNMKEIWIDNNPVYKAKKRLPIGYRFRWTIDCERDIFLLDIGGYTDRDLIITYYNWMLYIQGKKFFFRTFQTNEGSKNLKERPYHIVWDIDEILSDIHAETDYGKREKRDGADRQSKLRAMRRFFRKMDKHGFKDYDMGA